MSERSLAALAGHDEHARRELDRLLARYRQEGLTGLRALLAAYPMSEDEAAGLLVEAVLTLAERASIPAASRRAWEDFEQGEAADERRKEARR